MLIFENLENRRSPPQPIDNTDRIECNRMQPNKRIGIQLNESNSKNRQVCQLQRLTLKFCKTTAPSKGVRDFIEQDLIDFTKKNPGVVVYLKPRRFKTGVVVGEYLDGSYHWQSLHKMSREDVKLWLEFMTTRSGQAIQVFIKEHKIDFPSLQGPWHPFLNKPTELNVTRFPCEARSRFIPERQSATERLLEIAKESS